MSERILVCGSRIWPGTWEDIAVHLPADGNGAVTIIHGACSRIVNKMVGTRGGFRERVDVEVSVDTLAAFAARGLGHHVEAYPVDHKVDGQWPGAGPRRNARMLSDGKPDRGFAFGALWTPNLSSSAAAKRSGPWKHSGTGNMVGLMLYAKIPVQWIPGPGEPNWTLTSFPVAPEHL